MPILDLICEKDSWGNRPCDTYGYCMCAISCNEDWFIKAFAIKLKEAGLDYSYYVEKGYIEVANRKGIIEQFALTSISIGVVIVEKGRFSNILEIGDVGAQVKHVAKSIMGSSYAIDRRQG